MHAIREDEPPVSSERCAAPFVWRASGPALPRAFGRVARVLP